jgi:hypothetical protein
MSSAFRFGRRLPLPSTVQIRHDLIEFSALEAARKRHAAADGLPEQATWDEIGTHRAEAEKKLAAKPA